jgi:molybdopterin molybdotransferase
VISFDEAVALVVEAARPLGRERVTMAQAHRRVLAEAVLAEVDAPPSDVSSMDGYAVRDADLQALPARLVVADESFPSRGAEDPLAAGGCVRIFTGAPLPEGADRVVIQEEVERDGDFALFMSPPGEARHVRRRGSDFAKGETLLAPGRLLDPGALVAAAGADRAEVEVWRRPRLVLLGTGDELVEPGTARDRSGVIPESVSYGVAALAEEWGAATLDRLRLKDDLPELEKAAGEALVAADLVVVTGGASVGERDFAKAMFSSHGLDLIFSRVAIKPGKPVWLGRAGDRLVMGLPGNPSSALVTARLLLAPLLAGLSGRDPHEALRWRRAPLAAPLEACGSRETFVRAARDREAARPLPNQDSSAQKTLAAADLLIRRPAGIPAARVGDMVDVLEI